MDYVILICSKIGLRTERVLERGKIDRDQFLQRVNLQWPDKDKIQLADFVIYNNDTKEELENWKIRQGIPSFDREINGETNPYELGLADIINLDKGCYLGQEAMARFFRSKSLKCQLRYWEAYGESNEFDIGKKFFSISFDKPIPVRMRSITKAILDK